MNKTKLAGSCVVVGIAVFAPANSCCAAAGAATPADGGPASCEFGTTPGGRRIDLAALRTPILIAGDSTTAYRDPAVIYRDGVFRLYCTVNRREDDGRCYLHTAVMTSRDLLRWTRPQILTPRDPNLNYSSPGNVVRFRSDWVMCLQTYPTPRGETYGNETARLWIMRSGDLERWSAPELLRVKGPDVPVEKMGRMIDPFLVEDKDKPGTWWCFYKQRGASLSYSRDLRTWTYSHHIDAGENVCVLVDRDEYVMFHSPRNGIGVKRSKDMRQWRDVGECITLGQREWPWAQGRLTAGFVLDLRKYPEVGKALMFFHGSRPTEPETHGEASLGIAWSEDLTHWDYPR